MSEEIGSTTAEPMEYAPATDPTPEPVEEVTSTEAPPEPEPEVSPDWMYQQSQPEVPDYERASQQYYQQQYYDPYSGYQYNQQQYYDQQQYQQQGSSVEDFVRNPDAFLDRAIEQRLAQRLNELNSGVQNVYGMADAAVRAHAEKALSGAKDNIERGYKDVFNKDAAFTAKNSSIRGRVEGYMKSQWNQGLREAQQGNFRRLEMMANPKFAQGALALAKVLDGYPTGDMSGVRPGNAVVGGASPASTHETHTDIPADMLAAAERMGPGGVERLRKAYAESMKRGDVSFS